MGCPAECQKAKLELGSVEKRFEEQLLRQKKQAQSRISSTFQPKKLFLLGILEAEHIYIYMNIVRIYILIIYMNITSLRYS